MIKIQLRGNLEKEFLTKVNDSKKDVVLKAVGRLRRDTPVDTGYARDQWKVDSKGSIINDTQYLPELNHGSSKQAPAFFIESAMLEDPRLSPNGMIVTYK
jgi:hypothetical protein